MGPCARRCSRRAWRSRRRRGGTRPPRPRSSRRRRSRSRSCPEPSSTPALAWYLRRHDGLAHAPAPAAPGRRRGGGVGDRLGAARLLTAGRALDRVSEVTRSAEGAGAAVVRTGESIRDADVPVVGTVFKEAGDQSSRRAATPRPRRATAATASARRASRSALRSGSWRPAAAHHLLARACRPRPRHARAARGSSPITRTTPTSIGCSPPARSPISRTGGCASSARRWADGDHRDLADAELAREGVRRRAPRRFPHLTRGAGFWSASDRGLRS